MLKKIFITLLLSFFIFPTNNFAQNKIPSKAGHIEQKGEHKEKAEDAASLAKKIPDKMIMQDVFKNFTALIPYVSSPEQFADKKNEEKIFGHLVNITQAFSNANHGQMLNSKGFRISLETMQEHLRGTTEAFNSNHKNFALSRIKAATNMCISCHSQLPKDKGVSFAAFIPTINRKSFNSAFEYAEYLFIVRNYDKALKTYEDAIDEVITKAKILPAQDKDLFQVQGPLTRVISESIHQILLITLKVQQSPAKASTTLQKISKEKSIPKFIASDIQDYLKQLDVLQKVTLTSPKNDAELDQFISHNLEKIKESAPIGGPIDLKLIQASGILQHYLYNHFDTTDAPKIFYWVSMAERQLSRTFFFGLADLYLKECVRSNPKGDYAKKCITEYEDQLTLGYTGSAGTYIPEEDKKELEQLKKLVH